LSSPSLQTVLTKLIALTNERDVAALELSLAQALADLITPISLDASNNVLIYRAADLEKQLFTVVSTSKNDQEDILSEAFRAELATCFITGKHTSYVEEGLHASLYPLKNSKDQTMAIIALEMPVCDPQLHETIMMLLQIYENFTGLISDNEHDTLTGLLNRKTFESKINKVLTRMHKTNQRKDDQYKHYCFLAIFDIDHFKRVNDEFGHLIGDEVLLLFSQLMTQCFRDEDMLFRFGGEEFVGVFECASQQDIHAVLDRFREKVGNFAFPQVGNVTVSSGYTEIHSDDAPTQLIDHADLALYYAKNNGRNRICYYEQLIEQGDLQENKKEDDFELF